MSTARIYAAVVRAALERLPKPIGTVAVKEAGSFAVVIDPVAISNHTKLSKVQMGIA